MKFIGSIIALILLSGCTSHSDHKTVEDQIDSTASEMSSIKRNFAVSEPAVIRLTRPPVSKVVVSEESDPDWFSRSYKGTGHLPFGVLVRNIFEGTGVGIAFDNDLDQSAPASISFDGTLREVLDELAIASGYAYTIEGNHVSWHRMMTKVVNMRILPGKSSHKFGDIKSDDDNDNSDAADRTISRQKDSYSETLAELNVWEDIQSISESMASEDGNVFVSESAGTVTITDYPSYVRKISSVLEEYSKRMNQQTMVKISIITITHSDGRADSIDWNLVRNSVGTELNFFGSNSSSFKVFDEAPMGFKITNNKGLTAGSNLLLQALKKQTTATLSITPRMVAMHNQISEYNVTTDTGYLASSQTTITEGISETSLQGGLLTTGITIHFLPQIDVVQDEIVFDLTASISELNKLNVIESNNASIETPEIDKTQVKHRGKVKSGDTILVSGLERLIDDQDVRRNFDTDILGGAKNSNQSKLETLVLITPIIME